MENMVTLRRRGIFYLIEGEEAKKLAPILGEIGDGEIGDGVKKSNKVKVSGM